MKNEMSKQRYQQKGPYSDEELLESLREKARELGRKPTIKNCDLDNNMASSVTFIKHFGTWNNALKKAGLVPDDYGYRQSWDRQKMITSLQKKAKELDRTPTVADCRSDKNMPDPATYARHFGSWNNALKVAGLEIQYPHQQPYSSDEELLVILWKKAKKLGRKPEVADCRSDKNMPSPVTYAEHFGSWSKAVDTMILKSAFPSWRDTLKKVSKH